MTRYTVTYKSTTPVNINDDQLVPNGDGYDLNVSSSGGIPASLATTADQALYSTAPNTWAVFTLATAWRLFLSTIKAAWNETTGVLSSWGFQVNTAPTTTPASAPGLLVWNDTDGTIEFGAKGGNITIQIGQEEVVRVKNNAAIAYAGGEAVYISGSNGVNLLTDLANASSEATSAGTIGIVCEPIATNSHGFVTTFGLVRNINTFHLTEGAPVWLSTTAGGTTSTRPSAPNHGVMLGFCLRKHAVNGVIFVRVDNGWELDELHNVLITTPTNGQALVYDGTAGLWKNDSVSASDPTKLPLTGGTLTGGLTIQYPEVVTYLNSTDTTLGSYLILRSNGTNIGSFQAGGTTMTAPFGDQMRIRAYRAGGGIDFAVAGSATATHRMDASSNFMAAGGGWFGKAPATTFTDTFGNCEVYYAAATGGVKCGLAAIDTTTQAAGQGGGILFGGAFSGTTVTTAAVIRAAKTNSTAGNYSFGLDFYTRLNGSGALTKAMSITDTARVGIGVSPTAMLHLPAGTATASTAPLKINSGTVMATPEDGCVEYNGTKWYTTIGTDRQEVLRGATYSPTLTPTAVAANSESIQTFTVSGLIVPYAVKVSPPASMAGLGIMWARVSASNTLEIGFRNFTAGSLTPPSGTWRILGARN